MNKFAICRTGNGNPPPKNPKRSDAPVEEDPIDQTPQDVPAQPK